MTASKQTHVRYLIVAMLFIASCFSYGDRVALSIAGTAMERELALDPVKLGLLLSGFGWAYVAGNCRPADCWTGLDRSASMGSASSAGPSVRLSSVSPDI